MAALSDIYGLPMSRADLGTHSIAYTRDGEGGSPVLLVHGYPETRRIWARNVGPLARAGFDVVAPDLRGFGESDFAPDGCYDPAAYAEDLWNLATDILGFNQFAVVAGDLGLSVAIELAVRHPMEVTRLVAFNGNPPSLPDKFSAAGIPADPPRGHRIAADYFLAQGLTADEMMSELDTPARQRRYVASFYGHRFWSSSGAFSEDDIDFHVAPFLDSHRLRASWGVYEFACGKLAPSTPPRLSEPVEQQTLVLYGPEDHVVGSTFPDKCRVAFPNCVGPFIVPGVGHFVQWEAAEVMNRAIVAFLR